MHNVNRLLALMAACLMAALATGCAQVGQPAEPSAVVKASCPELPPQPEHLAPPAAALHLAEVRGWYVMCREAQLKRPLPQDPPGFTGFSSVNGVGTGSSSSSSASGSGVLAR